MSLISILFSLSSNSQAPLIENEKISTRLATVFSSMLTISESRIELSPWTSPILITNSKVAELSWPSSVVVRKCSIPNGIGRMCGIVETSAFPDIGGSVSVSIVGCPFNSQTILGKDGIGLSLTQPARKRTSQVEMISSSLQSCYFVNMSSIGHSRQPGLPHLDQKMLGCIVSLTSSHLSGSTIRDMNNGGSVLCSNSSFSSLLSSPNTDPNQSPPTATPPGEFTPDTFDDSKDYYFTTHGPNEETSVVFTNCDITGSNYAPTARLLTFNRYTCIVSIRSCCSTGCHVTGGHGGALSVARSKDQPSRPISISFCNFTSCSSDRSGGALTLNVQNPVTIEACRFVSCSSCKNYSVWGGGAALLEFQPGPTPSVLSDLVFDTCDAFEKGGGVMLYPSAPFSMSSCRFTHCSATNDTSFGGGLYHAEMQHRSTNNFFSVVVSECDAGMMGAGFYVQNLHNLSMTDCRFEHNHVVTESCNACGGGLFLYAATPDASLDLTGCRFVNCSAHGSGGAVNVRSATGVSLTDCVVEDCVSGTTGALMIGSRSNVTQHLSLIRVWFIRNSIGDNPEFCEPDLFNPTWRAVDLFIDVLFEIFEDPFNDGVDDPFLPFFTITECYSTSLTNCVSMVLVTDNCETMERTSERLIDESFVEIGPSLTEPVVASLDSQTGKIELFVKGKVPLEYQEYEMTLTDNEGETETKERIKFSDGTGTLVTLSGVSLKYNTSYTITSIVGIVPSSSSSSHSNAIPLATWAFNLAATPSLLTFTTPTPPPPCLVTATTYILSKEPEYAYIVLIFDRKVTGSFDVVVEEDGEDIRIATFVEGSSLTGESDKFVVVGENRFLTHDTTYTIKSIVRNPGADSSFVRMMETITFHIPQSSFVPPDVPEDPKKSMTQQMKTLLSWLIPLIVSVCALLVVLIVVFVLLRRRNKSQANHEEMADQDQIEDEAKIEVVEAANTNGILETEGMTHSAFKPSTDRFPFSSDSQPGKSSKEAERRDCAEVMVCSGDFAISTARMNTTLFSVLHRERREIGKRAVGMQIVNGLKQVVAIRGWSDVLTRLSSHWILIDTSGNVQLKLQMTSEDTEHEAALTRMQNPHPLANLDGNMNQPAEMKPEAQMDKSGMDGLRWRAPEVVVAEGRSGECSVDGHKAAVFSLGLVLWEIETGQVPFGELDAVNAQRQSGTGVGPKMESLQSTAFVSLILRCFSVDPKTRPTLSEIEEFLSSHPEDTHVTSGVK
ncbi:hypothetical protein BLNAU_3822 [Blattamonas nauphoetae]|uniref:Protein kinase domain-containing protein n=1 Tax=Blattamonas nauphoetae TaxID=2049346 RepID=A0ABQ9YBS2_9EUKA|nr:hypothetical protein BLNAU_3822 [Blattamonas nauphoetae]